MKKGSSSSTIIIIIVVLVVLIGGIIYFSKNKSGNNSQNNGNNSEESTNGTAISTTREIVSTPDADIMLFYGSTCSHCKKVNEYIVANDIDKVVKLQHLEIYNDKSNLELMKQKLQLCKNLSEDDKGGVPFLYSSETCLVGDTPIIDYLKSKAN